MRKQNIILALLKLETTHRKEIGNGANTHVNDDVPLRRRFRKRRRLNVRTASVARRLESLPANNVSQEFHRFRCEGLQNLGNTCYFNNVAQLLLNYPLVRQAIETAPQSIHTLRELRTLFTRMTNNDDGAFISPSKCLKAIMNTHQFRSVELCVNNRHEDVHQFIVKLPEHFDDKITVFKDVFNLPDVFSIVLQSTTTWRGCSLTFEESFYLWCTFLCVMTNELHSIVRNGTFKKVLLGLDFYIVVIFFEPLRQKLEEK